MRFFYSIMCAVFFSNAIFAGVPTASGKRDWENAADALNKIKTIESKVCALEGVIQEDFDGTFTVLNSVLEKACNSQTTTESIDSVLDVIQPDLPTIFSKLCVIDSKVDHLVGPLESMQDNITDIFTALDDLKLTVCSKLEVVTSDLDKIQVDVTNLTQSEIEHTQTILSKLSVLEMDVDTLNSAIDVLPVVGKLASVDSCTDQLVSLVDDLRTDVCNLEVDIEIGFAGTFTALDAQLVKACDLVSLADTLDATAMVDLSGVFTALDALQTKVCDIDSLVDIVCFINCNNAMTGVNSKTDIALSKICQALEVVTPLPSVADAVISKLETVDMNGFVDVCSNIEAAVGTLHTIESKVDTIESIVDVIIATGLESRIQQICDDLITVDSKLDTIDVMDSKLCVIDSKIDYEKQEVLTVDSLVDVVGSQVEDIASVLDALVASSIESKVSNILDDTFTICSNVDELILTLTTVDSKVDYIIENMPQFGYFVYVVNSSDDTVTPIEPSNNTTLPVVGVEDQPQSIAIAPDGSFAYVTNLGSGTVTPIDLSNNTALLSIAVGTLPQGIAITPDGSFAYVTSPLSGVVTPIDLSDNTLLPTIAVGTRPRAIAITPDGSFAYVTDSEDDTVTPIDLSDNTTCPAIAVGDAPFGIAITPDGSFAYVTNSEDDTVTPIDLSDNTTLPAIAVGDAPFGIAITPDGFFAYVANFIDDSVRPIDLSDNTTLPAITVGNGPSQIAIAPDGAFAYVANFIDGTVTPIDLSDNTIISPAITVGGGPRGIAVTPGSIKDKVVVLKSKICRDLILTDSLNSKLDIVESLVCAIESNMDVANGLIDQASMKAADLENDFTSTWTILDTIEQKLCTSESVLEVADSKLDATEFVFDFSGVFTVVDTILDKECTVDSKMDIMISLADVFVENQGDLTGIYTVLDALLEKVCTIDSQTDIVDNTVDNLVAFCGIPIRNGDLPLTISTPGRYFLAEDIDYTGASTLITITVDDVFLDLNNRTLNYTGASSGVSIIFIDTVTNVTVANGTITGFTDDGIGIENTSNTQLINLTILDGTGATTEGISLVSTSNIIIKNVLIDNVERVGILASGTGASSNVVIKDTDCHNNRDGIVYGVSSDRWFISRTIASNNMERGIYLQDNQGSGVVESCKTLDNIQEGIFIQGTIGAVVKNCISDGNGQGISIQSFNLDPSLENVVIHNTVINNGRGFCLRDNISDCMNNYVAFNTCIENASNIDELEADTGPNTYLGNFAFNSTAAGSPDNTNYTVALSNITGKFSTVSQSSSFIDRPTKWTNINMLP